VGKLNFDRHIPTIVNIMLEQKGTFL